MPYDRRYPTRNREEREEVLKIKKLLVAGEFDEDELKGIKKRLIAISENTRDLRAANRALQTMLDHFQWQTEYTAPKEQNINVNHHLPAPPRELVIRVVRNGEEVKQIDRDPLPGELEKLERLEIEAEDAEYFEEKASKLELKRASD